MGKWIGLLPSTDKRKHMLIDEMDTLTPEEEEVLKPLIKAMEEKNDL